MAEKLTELDTTKLTTPIKNWMSRQGNAAIAGKSGRAMARHEKRLIANKAYKMWQRYLVSRKRAGTSADMDQFIQRTFDPEVRDELSRELPDIFRPGPGPPGSPGAGGNVPPGGSPDAGDGSVPPGGPTGGAPDGGGVPPSGGGTPGNVPPGGWPGGAPQSNAQPQATQQPAQGSAPTGGQGTQPLAGARVSAKNIADMPPHIQAQIKSAQTGTQPPAAQPAAQQPAAQPVAAQPAARPTVAAAQPARPTAAPTRQPTSNLNIPTPPHGFRASTQPPRFLRRQRNEGQVPSSRRLLTEAPDDLNIPQPPPGTKQRMYRSAPDMSQPPAFLRRQQNQPAPAPQPAKPLAPTQPAQSAQPRAQPAQATRPQKQKPLTRAMQDKVMMSLAGILIDKHMASAQPQSSRAQTAQTTANSQVQGARKIVNGQTLLDVMRYMTIDQQTMTNISAIIARNPNPSIATIVQGLKGTQIDPTVMLAIEKAMA